MDKLKDGVETQSPTRRVVDKLKDGMETQS